MKVAFDPQAFTIQAYGGVSRVFARLAPALAGLGCEVSVLAPFHQNRYLQALPEGLVQGSYKGDFNKWQRRFWNWRSLRRCRELLANGSFDLVHETYYRRGKPAPKGLPTVLTVYDMTHELLPDAVLGAREGSRIKRQAVARADHMICISESTRRDLVRLFNVPEEKTSVAHLGVDAPLEHTEAPAEPIDGPFLLYVGHRRLYKNFDLLVEALAASPALASHYKLVAFGGGPFSAEERSRLEQVLGEGGAIQLAGSDALLGWLYQRAAVTVYPSRYEGFGLVPLEAMSYNCPVITAAAGPMPEVNGDAAEYFDPEEVDSLVAALEAVLGSEARADELRALGSAHWRQFSWERCAERTLVQYQRLLGVEGRAA